MCRVLCFLCFVFSWIYHTLTEGESRGVPHNYSHFPSPSLCGCVRVCMYRDVPRSLRSLLCCSSKKKNYNTIPATRVMRATSAAHVHVNVGMCGEERGGGLDLPFTLFCEGAGLRYAIHTHTHTQTRLRASFSYSLRWIHQHFHVSTSFFWDRIRRRFFVFVVLCCCCCGCCSIDDGGGGGEACEWGVVLLHAAYHRLLTHKNAPHDATNNTHKPTLRRRRRTRLLLLLLFHVYSPYFSLFLSFTCV